MKRPYAALDARARGQVEAVRKKHGEQAARLVAAKLAQAATAPARPVTPPKPKKKRAPKAKGLGVPPLRRTTDRRFSWPLGVWCPTYERAGLLEAAARAGVAVVRLDFGDCGPPQPKQRAGRRRTTSGLVVSFNPAKTAAYEARLLASARRAMVAQGWPEGGWRDPRVRYLVEAEFVLPADRGDADNLMKALKDSMNGWVFPDDQRVAGNNPIRRAADPSFARTKVTVYAVGPAECLADRLARPDPPKAPRARASRKKAAA